MAETKRGIFIVIDGTDGAGKTTQTELLVQRMKQEGYPVMMTEFPQFEKKSAGPVAAYLNGNYGSLEEVGPYRASILYAVDRYDGSFAIRKALASGYHVICTRYVTANMGHQGSKITDPIERQKFFDWLYELEYGIFAIPKADLNIILHVNPEIGQELIKHRAPKQYLEGKTMDIHEASLDHLQKTEAVYLEIAQKFPDFKKIECASNGVIMSVNDIHHRVWQTVESFLQEHQT